MEVYILDSLLRRERVVDQFESLIWTERFNKFGDFEMVLRSSRANRTLLKPGVRLAMNMSHRVMTVETVENGVDSEGKTTLNIRGNSIESILDDRVAKAAMGTPTWEITDTPADVVRTIFHDICIAGTLSPYDIIAPTVVEGTFIVPTSNIVEPVDPITVNLPVQTVYKAITDICDIWTLGFRLLRQDNPTILHFDVYAGSDRTSGQTVLRPVIFAPELDNLQNTKELNSIESSKNCAYVFAPNGYMIVYPEGVAPDTEGFDRRVMYIDASDITLAAGPALDAALLQRGKDELAKARTVKAFDGEINQNSQYRYERDYFLGDLVEMRNIDGDANQMRVTEQIFVSDEQGERSYPTLTLNQFINTGSWLSWEANQQWIDFDAEFWDELA
jgi:Siphovirus ReqiPepy6 Gp37-like protein